jgi:hypothetical protein
MHPANACRIAVATGAALLFVLGSSSVGLNANNPPTAESKPIFVKLIEWDLPQQLDNVTGGMTVDVQADGNRIWFTTRVQQGDAPRLYQFDIRGGKKVNDARWISYELDPNFSGVANGLRKVRTSRDKDKRFVFVHTGDSVQRIDTLDCTKVYGPDTPLDLTITGLCARATWVHNGAMSSYSTPDPNGPADPLSGSDVAIDDYNNVYTVSAAFVPEPPIDGTSILDSVSSAPAEPPAPGTSFLQRLSPDKSTNNVKRWYVGHQVGRCSSGTPCLSGIAYDKRRDKIYFSQPGDGFADFGAIAELDPKYNKIRRWTFAKLSKQTYDDIREPRQLSIDKDGKIWVVTASRHVVSLDVSKNRMTKHKLPALTDVLEQEESDPFGITTDDGSVGYTDASPVRSIVGMLLPDRDFAYVDPDRENVASATLTIEKLPGMANRTSGRVSPKTKTVLGQRVKKDDGTFIEAFTNNGNDSFMPLGITPDLTAHVGTFFYAVGDPASPLFNRVGRVRFARGDERGRHERDDDDGDDDGKRHDKDDDDDDDGSHDGMDGDDDNDGDPDFSDKDDDNDGIDDDFDTKTHKESRQASEQELLVGQAVEDPFTVNPGTLVVAASATSSNLLAPVTIEVVNATGQVVAASLPSLGAAALTWIPPSAGGSYTLRVRNSAGGPVSIATKILTRELWPLPAL